MLLAQCAQNMEIPTFHCDESKTAFQFVVNSPQQDDDAPRMYLTIVASTQAVAAASEAVAASVEVE